MKKNNYLLQNTTEAEEMKLHLENLLFSDDEANNELALQLLEGGGVPKEFYPYLWIYSFSVDEDTKIHQQIMKMLNKVLSEKQQSIYQKCDLIFKEKYDQYLDNPFAVFVLEQINVNPETAQQLVNFGKYFLLKHQLGANFLLKNKILSDYFIFQTLINNDHLDLSDFGLTEIPETIGSFVHLKSLNIDKNPLKDIPDNLKNLKNLKYLNIDINTAPKVMQKLERMFPTILSKIYEEAAWNKVNVDKLDFALNFMKKASDLTPERSVVWDGLAWIYMHIEEYQNVFDCYEKAIILAENQMLKATYLANLSSAFQRYRMKENAYQSAQKAIDILNNIPQKEWLEDGYFSFALSLQMIGDYQKALSCYEIALQLNPYYGDGVIHYNRACIFALLDKKEDFLNELKQACVYSHFNWYKDALSDTDFEKYWNEEELHQMAEKVGTRY